MLIRSLNKANYLLQKQSTSQGAAAAFGFVWGLLFGFFNVSGINNICLACSMYVVFCKKKCYLVWQYTKKAKLLSSAMPHFCQAMNTLL